MSPELLQLHVAQLSRTLGRSKTNKYADPRKQEYHSCLIDLFQKVSAIDFNQLSYLEQLDIKKILDFCFLSIEFLDNSTLVNIPHEIVYCLEKALNEWDKSERYIIVTSLQNNIISYSFNPTLALDETIYDLVFAKFDISFRHRLIQINLPKYLAHDYLANVVLYHELGHFVDLRYSISARIMMAHHLNDSQRRHFAELFSDVFASQYIGFASNYYLDYIAHKAPNSFTHPATDNRIKIVEDFLNSNQPNDYLKIILTATKSITGNDMKPNTDTVDSTEFIPPILDSEGQLHSIFEVGWNLWKSEIAEFNEKNIDQDNKYQIINNLIEKSISNYMITEKWNTHVSD